jgi:hypothetical protein
MPIGELLKHRLVQLRVPRGTPHENLELLPNAFEGVARPQVPASYRNLLGGDSIVCQPRNFSRATMLSFQMAGDPRYYNFARPCASHAHPGLFIFCTPPAQKCAACLVRKPPALLRASARLMPGMRRWRQLRNCIASPTTGRRQHDQPGRDRGGVLQCSESVWRARLCGGAVPP